jgi:protein-tyrosine phosphatase
MVTETKSHKVLFVCTGNYYRSRFAEIYFNSLAEKKDMYHRAFSRGFEAYMKRNKGPISVYTLEYLTKLGITFKSDQFPVQLQNHDLNEAKMIVLMDAEEHVPLYKKYFPDRNDHLQLWDCPDIQYQQPEKILPLIREKVNILIHSF